MATHTDFSFKTSPIAFVKRVFVLELITGLVTFGYRYFHLLNPLNYNTTNPNPLPPPDTFLTLTFISIFQIVAITIIFFSWYLENYLFHKNSLTFSRTDIFKKTLITDLSTITSIHISQGSLASTLNYGSLIIYTQDFGEIHLHNLSNPRELAKNIRRHTGLLDKPSDTTILNQPLQVLLKKPEGQHIEFKSSLQWDYQQNQANKGLHKATVKNIAAFLNSQGGCLIIGVDDKGKILGLQADFSTLKKKNSDGFENTLTMTIKKYLGVDALRYLQISFETIKDKTVAKVICQPSPKPTFLKNDSEEFYIRTGNSCQPLTISQAVTYIQEHFSS